MAHDAAQEDTMKPMTSPEIWQAFLDFFAERGHTVVPSSSLIPVNDPTLLFVNAGMVQFKNVFLGLEERPYRRATTVQKCMRVSGKHNDIENVGPSPRHHSFFFMLGNFSFGDYFKREAIRYAYDCLTRVFHLPSERLVYTVFHDDEEAFSAWTQDIGVAPERVYRMGEKTNFWSMGDTGPCGPTSEVHYDFGPEACTCHEPNCSVALDNGCNRWLEIWNLVFMQYNQAADGTRTPLPRPGVDTGMGLERLASIIQGVPSDYDTDLFVPIIRRTQELLGHSDAQVQEHLVGYRVIADHVRAMVFLIGDGVLPGNEGRRYVLRLILRRAARHGKLIGFEGPFLGDVAEVVIEQMAPYYEELARRRDFILQTIRLEEERFQQTLSIGLRLLESEIAGLQAQGKTILPGPVAFKLYDTYGFPIDLTKDVARENGLTVDEVGFHQAMEEQRERSRGEQPVVMDETRAAYARLLNDLKATGALDEDGVLYDPYSTTEVDTVLVAILRLNEGAPPTRVRMARQGERVELVIPITPFYVESGGQVSDTGVFAQPREGSDELQWEVQIEDTRQPVPGLIVHTGQVTQGTVREGDPCWAMVDYERRWDIMRNHTATHLLHSELRYVLGEHVHQAGSLVAPDRLRFDFTHPAMMTQEELAAVQRSVNAAILANYPVETVFTDYRTAVAEGAMALFGEKYGDVVRTLRIGPPDQPFSYELCGGTHVNETAEIGLFHILSESSVGAGVRRIEAVTGRAAYELVERRLGQLDNIAAYLGIPADQVDRRVLSLLEEAQDAQKEVARLRRLLAQRDFEAVMKHVQEVNGVPVLAARVEASDADMLREMSDWFRQRVGSGVVVLGAAMEGRPSFVAAVTPDLVKRGLDAGRLVKAVARVVGGGGGGKPTLAQAGGRDVGRLKEALAQVPQLVAEALRT